MTPVIQNVQFIVTFVIWNQHIDTFFPTLASYSRYLDAIGQEAEDSPKPQQEGKSTKEILAEFHLKWRNLRINSNQLATIWLDHIHQN